MSEKKYNIIETATWKRLKISLDAAVTNWFNCVPLLPLDLKRPSRLIRCRCLQHTAKKQTVSCIVDENSFEQFLFNNIEQYMVLDQDCWLDQVCENRQHVQSF